MRMAKMKQNGITPRPNQKSLADAFDIKPKELNDFKQQMIHSQPFKFSDGRSGLISHIWQDSPRHGVTTCQVDFGANGQGQHQSNRHRHFFLEADGRYTEE